MKYLNLGCGTQFHPDWVNIDFVSTQEGVMAHDLRQGIPFEDASFDVVYHSHVLEHFSRPEAERFLEECHRVLRPQGIIRVVVPDLEQIAKLYIKALEKASGGSEEWADNYNWILLELFDQVARNQGGGDMAGYLADETIPNESFVVERIGFEGENLMKQLRPIREQLQPPLSFNPETDDFEETALKIGKFRLSGEVHQWMYDRYSLQRLLTKTGFTDFKVCEANESRIPDFDTFGLDIQPDGKVRKPDSLFVEALECRPNYWHFINTTADPSSLKVVQLNTMDIRGGAARAAYRLHKGLQTTGQRSLMLTRYKVSKDETVCAVNTPSQESHFEEFNALQTHYINGNRTHLSNTLFNFTYPGWDVSTVEEVQDADIIQLHWLASFQSPQTIKQLASLGKPIVWTFHDMWAFTGGCHYSAGCEGYQTTCESCPQLKDDPFGLASAILQDKLDLLGGINLTIVTPSYWLADCVRKSALFKHQPVEVIPNGVEIDRFIPIPKREAKESLGIKANTFTLLIGAENGNEKRKGFWEMLQALEVCLEDEKFFIALQQGRVKLLCFGLPHENLHSLNIPVVSFGDVYSDDKLAEIYSAADLFVLPSLEDNLPNTLLESMSCGTPVIGFEVGGLLDVVQEDITGKLVSVGDSVALGKGILSYFSQPEKREGMGKKCRQLIEEKYSLSVQGKAYLDLYQSLLSKQPSSPRQSSSVGSYKKLKGIFAPIQTEFNSVSGIRLQSVLRHSLTEEIQQTKREIEKLITQNTEKSKALEILQDEYREYQQSHLSASQLNQVIQQNQQEIQQLNEEIEAMRTSKFWKLRSLWFKIKKIFGLPTTD
ncbi:MAG: glycosyltransferase [Crocosphaera sp.]